MGKRVRRAKPRTEREPVNNESPFTRSSLGSFSGTDIQIFEAGANVALKGAEVGKQIALEASEPKPLAKWVIGAYILILIFAFFIVFIPGFSDYRQAAIGFIFGQIPLLLKSHALKDD
jgi:hypothetical protein